MWFGGRFDAARPNGRLASGRKLLRTFIVAAVGLFLSVAFVFAAISFGKGRFRGEVAFMMLWFLFCAIDFSNGVKARYKAIDELWIHLVLFVVPAAGAWAAARFLP
jgi:hypothetical protein